MTPRLRTLLGSSILALWAGACGRSQEPERSSPAGAPATPAGARLVIEPLERDFGNARQYTEVLHSVFLRNIGGTPLSFQTEAGHSCTAVPSQGELAPQEHRELELHCRPALHGVFADQVIVRSNDPKEPERRIAVSGRVEPALVLEPDFLEVRLPFGGTHTEEIRAAGARAHEAKLSVERASLDGPQPATGGWPEHGLSVDTKPVDSDTPDATGPKLRVRFDAKRPGMHAGNLVVSTGLDEPREIPLSYLFVVAGTLEVSPIPVYLNLRAAGEKATTIVVRSSQPSFTVKAVNVLDGPFEAAFTRVNAGSYRVDLRVLEDRLDAGIHGVNGRIEIQSNDRTEPRKEIPVFAFGRALP